MYASASINLQNDISYPCWLVLHTHRGIQPIPLNFRIDHHVPFLTLRYNVSVVLTQRLRKDTSLAFVYVPKTSGTYLNIKSIPEEKAYVNDYRPSTLPSSSHMPTSRVQSIVGEDTPLFTVVRDPYDRTCSEYYFIKKEVDKFLSIVPWDVNDLKRLRWMSIKSGKIMGSDAYAEKIYHVYSHNMSVEDYLIWTTDNPTYPRFYDTKTPTDLARVGKTEEIEKTIFLLKKIYDVDAGTGKSNQNIKKDVGRPYETKYSRLDFEKNNRIEYELYQQGVDKFNKILSETTRSS